MNRVHRVSHLPFSTLLCLALALNGCGTASHTKPSVSTITFTDANGKAITAVSALTAGTGIYLDATVLNDSQLLGVNWSVSCSDALPVGTPLPPGETVDQSCGFFAPIHTATAPVPSYAASGAGVVTFFQAPAAQPKAGTVTVYASSTADPSQAVSVTLSILP